MDSDLKSLNQVSATCEHHNGGPSVTNDLFAHLFVDASFLIEILFAIRWSTVNYITTFI